MATVKVRPLCISLCLRCITILEDVISKEQYGIGFKLGNEELRDQVWNTLLEMEADGTVDEIADKYDINKDNICIGE